MDAWRKLNDLPHAEAREALTRCCGAQAWVRGMLSRRPFASEAAVYEAAEKSFGDFKKEDWLEAFAAHPKIGEKKASGWAQKEQSGAASASAAVLDELARLNEEYAKKFGIIFIVCATGKSAEEMLAILKERIGHDLPVEMCKAAGEQTKITKLRLEKLLSDLGARA